MVGNAEPLHFGRGGAPQIVQDPALDAARLVERPFKFAEPADLAAAAGENVFPRRPLSDQCQRQRRQFEAVRSARFVFDLPPDAIQNIAMSKRGRLIAPLRRTNRNRTRRP